MVFVSGNSFLQRAMRVLAIYLLLYSLVSGRKYPGDSNIHGGSKVNDISEMPYVAFLNVARRWKCGGTIAAELYVVTACRCVTEEVQDPETKAASIMAFGGPFDEWVVLAGTTNVDEPDPTMQKRIPQTIYYHPYCQYHPYRSYDAGLVKVSEPFVFNKFVRPVDLAITTLNTKFRHMVNLSQKGRSQWCTVAGWGNSRNTSMQDYYNKLSHPNQAYSSTTPAPNEGRALLKTVDEKFLHDGLCVRTIMEAVDKAVRKPNLRDKLDTFFKNAIFEQVCGISRSRNESACDGDTGSGFVCDGILIGINSWGLGCGSPEPDIYQSMYTVIDWVKSNLCSLESCLDARHLSEYCPRPSTMFSRRCSGLRPLSTGSTFSPRCFMILAGTVMMK